MGLEFSQWVHAWLEEEKEERQWFFFFFLHLIIKERFRVKLTLDRILSSTQQTLVCMIFYLPSSCSKKLILQISSCQPFVFFCWDTHDIKQMSLHAKHTSIEDIGHKGYCSWPFLNVNQKSVSTLLLKAYHNASAWCDSLDFPKAVTAWSPIPHILLAIWLWRSFHWDVGSVSSWIWADLRL